MELASCFAALDLRFPSKTDETAFKASLEPEVLLYGMMACLAALAYTIYFCVAEIVVGMYSLPDSLESGAKAFYFFTLLSTAVVAGVLLLLSLLWLRQGWLKSCNWEFIVLMGMIYQTVMVIVTNSWHTALLFGEQPSEFWGRDVRGDELVALLCYDAFLTGVALYIPIRVCLLWIIPLCGVALYIIMTMLAGPAFPDYVVSFTLLLFILGYVAVHGAYRVEKCRRELWKDSRQLTQRVAVQEAEIEEARIHISQQQQEVNDFVGSLPQGQHSPANLPTRTRGSRRATITYGQGTLPTAERQSVGSSARTDTSLFDGYWILLEAEGRTDLWLHSIHILGVSVTLGNGAKATLKRRPDNQLYLAGGCLSLQDERLCRVGKSGRRQQFKRAHSMQSKPAVTDTNDSDIETYVSSSAGVDEVADARDFELSSLSHSPSRAEDSMHTLFGNLDPENQVAGVPSNMHSI